MGMYVIELSRDVIGVKWYIHIENGDEMGFDGT